MLGARAAPNTHRSTSTHRNSIVLGARAAPNTHRSTSTHRNSIVLGARAAPSLPASPAALQSPGAASAALPPPSSSTLAGFRSWYRARSACSSARPCDTWRARRTSCRGGSALCTACGACGGWGGGRAGRGEAALGIWF